MGSCLDDTTRLGEGRTLLGKLQWERVASSAIGQEAKDVLAII